MHDRHALPLALAVLLLAAAAGRAQSGAGVISGRSLAQLAELLTRTPNDGMLHLETATQYFQRGVVGDAGRVRRHLQRATELDSSLSRQARRMLDRAPPGDRTRPRSDEEEMVDEVIEAALGPYRGGEQDELVAAGLAERMSLRNLDRPLLRYPEAVEEYTRIMGWRNGEVNWSVRLDALRSEFSQGLEGWEEEFRQRTVETLEIALSLDEEQEGADELGPGDTPDPFVLKHQASLDFLEGRLPEAVEGYIQATAAAEVRKNLVPELDEEEAFLIEEDEEAPADEDLVETVRDPGAEVLQGGDPPPEGPDPRDDLEPELTPPDQYQELADQSLETLEAMSNGDVAPEQVLNEVMEVAPMGLAGDPLVLDLDRSGAIELFGGLVPDGVLTVEGSVLFDLDGNGRRERTEWLLPGRDGLLAVDLDHDGVIRDGRELFGNAHGDRHGFARLATFDLDGDGWVEGAEAANLSVWVDDGDGRCDPGELRSLGEHGIEAISVRPDARGSSPVRARGGPMRCWDWMPDIREERRLP